MEKAVSHTHRKVFSWKTDQELGSPWAVAGKEGSGATSREAGVWGASRRGRVLQSHPSHESRGSPGGRAGGQAAGLAPAIIPVAAALADVSGAPLPLSTLSPFCFPPPVPPSIVVTVPDPSHPLPLPLPVLSLPLNQTSSSFPPAPHPPVCQLTNGFAAG